MGFRITRLILIWFSLSGAASTRAGAPPCSDWEQSFFWRFKASSGHSVRQTADGGAITVGNRVLEADEDVYLVKTSSSGRREWEAAFDGTWADYGYGVVQTPDGGYAVSCVLAGRSTLLKTGPRGELIWQETLGKYYAFGCLDLLDDGGFLIAGNGAVGPEEANLVRTDGDGKIVWARKLGAYVYHAEKTPGGNIIATSSGTAYWSTTLSLLDPRGEVIWEKILKMADGQIALYGRAVRPASDGGYLVGGDAEYLANKQHRLCLLRTDARGEVLWTTIYDQFPGFGWSLAERSGGGAVLRGGYFRPIVIGADSSGELLWDLSWPRLPQLDIAIQGVERTADGGYLVAGGRPYTSASSGLLIAKLAPERGTEGLFIRGDSNGDGTHDISDPVATLEALFLGGARLGCRDAADANDDGVVDVADPVRSLTFLFVEAPALGPPGRRSCCGADPTPDLTDCDSFPYCGAP